MTTLFPIRTAPLALAPPAAVSLRRPGTLAAGWFALASAALLLMLPDYALTEWDPEYVVWTTALLTFALCTYIVRRHRRIGLNPWASAVVLTLAFYAFRYGWGALVVYYWEHVPWEALPQMRLRFYHQGGRLAVEGVCDLIMLGALGLFLGVLLPTRGILRRLPNLNWPVDDRKLRRNIVLFMPVAAFCLLFLAGRAPAAAHFFLDLTGRFLYLANVLCGYWLFTSRTARERGKWLAVLLATAGLSLAMGLMTGMMGEVLAPAVFTVFGYMLARARLPWGGLAVVLPVAFLVVFPFLTIYKSVAAEHKDTDVSRRIDYTLERVGTIDYQRGLELGLDRVVARLAESAYPAIFERYFPSVYPFENGRTLLLELETFVPRFVWPHKPDLNPELNRYSAAVGIVREGDGTSAVFDAVSEYYVNFGAPGVFSLSVLHGWYMSLLTAWCMRNLKGPVAGAMSMAVFFTNPEFFGVGQAVNVHIKLLPVWVLYLYVLSRRTGKAY